jgi:tRNA-binding EMAP/Myf-like protein
MQHLALPRSQPVGCTTRSGMKIEQAVLRGVESFGMLCSAHECGWVSEPGGGGGTRRCLLRSLLQPVLATACSG